MRLMATARKRNAGTGDQFDGVEPDEFGRVPGDVTTEPVATAAQSAREGNNRVGPPTIAQDATAEFHTPPGVTQIVPGDEAPADTPQLGGAIELDDVYDEHGHDVSEHKSSGTKLAEREPVTEPAAKPAAK